MSNIIDFCNKQTIVARYKLGKKEVGDWTEATEAQVKKHKVAPRQHWRLVKAARLLRKL